MKNAEIRRPLAKESTNVWIALESWVPRGRCPVLEAGHGSEQVRAEWVRCRISSHTLLIPGILPGMGLFWRPIAQAWKAAQPRVSRSP
jgi:hypothetical protein